MGAKEKSIVSYFRLIFFYLYVQFTTFTWKGKFVPQKYVFTQGRNSHKFSKKHDYTDILVKKKGLYKFIIIISRNKYKNQIWQIIHLSHK